MAMSQPLDGISLMLLLPSVSYSQALMMLKVPDCSFLLMRCTENYSSATNIKACCGHLSPLTAEMQAQL